MPPDKRRPQPGGNGRGPLECVVFGNGDGPEDSHDQLPAQGLIPIGLTVERIACSSPCRRLGVICAEIVADLRRQRLAERLHRLGPRPVLEALAEVEAGKPLDSVLVEFARLDSETDFRAAT